MTIESKALYEWVKQYTRYTTIEPIQGDASTRRYFRVKEKNASYIAVFAPPKSENNQAFVHVAKRFLKSGLNVPEILGVDYEQGYLLLSDLGDTQLLKILNKSNVDQHYSNAFNDLILLQNCLDFTDWELPHFNSELLLEELSRFDDWYLNRHLGLTLTSQEHQMLQEIYGLLIASAQDQPQVCVHRDYHSRNLMLLPNGEIGILDFQDAVIGPVTYDLVSLLRDCYIQWQVAEVYNWVEQFWELLISKNKITAPLQTFTKWFDWMGLQRHLKVLGIFARLYRRDNKASYLQDIPLVLQYVSYVCDKYPEFSPLRNFIQKRVTSR